MKPKTDNEMFLKTFCELELKWLSDRNYQLKAWSSSSKDLWAECIMLYSEAWSVISKNPTEFKLYDNERKLLDNLYEMIKAFMKYYPDSPESPTAYQKLLADPEWKKVQQFAQQVRDKIYPRLK